MSGHNANCCKRGVACGCGSGYCGEDARLYSGRSCGGGAEDATTKERCAMRDEFAKIALNALIIGRTWGEGDSAKIIEAWATGSYAVADAMLAAREKGGAA